MKQSDPTICNTFYAHRDGEIGADLEAVTRFHSVKRWHMIDTTRQQTLAEHSANVALLAMVIATTCPRMYFGPSASVVQYALLHDLPEVYTGDIPSHTKGFIDGIDDLEDAVVPKHLQSYIYPDGAGIGILVKLCDLADGIRFIRMHGIGATAKHAEAGLAGKLETLKSQMGDGWPVEVYDHVIKRVMLYAYEYS